VSMGFRKNFGGSGAGKLTDDKGLMTKGNPQIGSLKSRVVELPEDQWPYHVTKRFPSGQISQ